MLSLLECYDDVAIFHKAFEAPAPSELTKPIPGERMLLRYRLMNEEFTELIQELPNHKKPIESIDWPNLVKEVIDCIVVNTGTIVEMGARPTSGVDATFIGVMSNATSFLPGVKDVSIDNLAEQMMIIGRYRTMLSTWYNNNLLDGVDVVIGKKPFSHSEGYLALMYELFYIMLLCPLRHEVWGMAWSEVHRSNMSKLGPDGKPIRREDGKILKGPNYSKADLTFVTEYLNGTI